MTEQIHYEIHISLMGYKGVSVYDRFLRSSQAAKKFDEIKAAKEYKQRELTLVKVTISESHSLVEPFLTKPISG